MSRFAAKPAAAHASSSFNWTFSKLKTFENCAKKYSHLYVLKDVTEEDSEHLRVGNEVHAALAKAVLTGQPLAADLADYQHWVDKFRAGVGTPGVELLVEQKLAIDENFQPVEFFARKVWMRGVIDVAKIIGDVAVVADWKTGKPQEDLIQLALFAALTFAHKPQLKKIRTEFIWLKDNFSTREDFSREDMVELWSSVLPRVESLRNSHDTMEFPAVQNALCRYCPVLKCAHNKKG